MPCYAHLHGPPEVAALKARLEVEVRSGHVEPPHALLVPVTQGPDERTQKGALIMGRKLTYRIRFRMGTTNERSVFNVMCLG